MIFKTDWLCLYCVDSHEQINIGSQMESCSLKIPLHIFFNKQLGSLGMLVKFGKKIS